MELIFNKLIEYGKNIGCLKNGMVDIDISILNKDEIIKLTQYIKGKQSSAPYKNNLNIIWVPYWNSLYFSL